MEHLFNNVTWKQYLNAALVATVIYYGFIAWKYCSFEIKRLIARLNGKTGNPHHLPPVLQYQEDIIADTSGPAGPAFPEGEIYSQELPFSGQANDLARQVSACIDEAAEKPFDPALLIPKLRKILNDYPDVPATTDREKINALVVSQCENTGTALLSESEVDLWWSA
jgi:hypothetical protein